MITAWQNLFEDNGIDYAVDGKHTRQGWIQIHCPFCTHDHSFHLGIHGDGKGANCWKCHRKSVWEIMEKILPKQPNFYFAEYPRLREFSISRTTYLQTRKELKTPRLQKGLSKLARGYLKKRGFKNINSLKNDFDLCSISPYNQMGARIYIPIFGANKQAIAYTMRYVGNRKGAPRYLNCPKGEQVASKTSILYGEHLIKGDTVIVVEGPCDVWKLRGYAVATLGVGFSEAQLCQLSVYNRVIVLFDADKPGQVAGASLAEELSVLGVPKVERWVLESGDPGDMSDDEIKEIIYGV